MKKRLYLAGMLTLICAGALAFESNADAQGQKEIRQIEKNNEVGTKNLYSLKRNPALSKSGTSRGVNHDKQDIGLILKAGSAIEVRQKNPKFTQNIRMDLLTNGEKSENSMTFNSSWQSLKTNHDTAVFFETPFDVTEEAQIEYKISGETVPLPIYERGQDENNFFNTWDQTQANLGLIKSSKMQMLVPSHLKPNIKNLKDFSSLDELITHYDQVFNFADYNLGLDNSNEYNKVVPSKYFIKEDKDTSAGGYYGSRYTVSHSLEEFWLPEVQWGQLHEIHHGYQPNYNSKGIFTGEVSNNLYNVHYLKKYHGKQVVENNWLFNYGRKGECDNTIEAALNSGTHYSNLGNGHRPALILLTMLDQKAGDDALRHLNQVHRQSWGNGTHENLNYQDRLIQSYGEFSGFDFTPAIQNWNVDVDKDISKNSRDKNYRPVAHLDHVVPKNRQNEVMESFDKKERLSSRFQVVDNDDIAFLGLKGNVTIRFGQSLGKTLDGETVSLKDGDKTVASATVSNNSVEFKEIPNGVYSLKTPETPYNLTNHYAYVKDKENDLSIDEENINTFEFLGLSDDHFASLKINSIEDRYLDFQKLKEEPHYYFKNEKYAGVAVHRNNEIIYSKNINGDDASLYNQKVPLQTNDVIEIYHNEPQNRLLSSDKSLIDNQKKTQYLQMMDNHLKRISSSTPEEPVEKENTYDVSFKGYNDREFATFTHDRTKGEGRLETKSTGTKVHHAFDKEYASITVQDSQGKQTFNQSYKGTETYNNKVDTMAIKEGDYLTFKHLEPNGGDTANGRLSIIDKQTDTTMEKAEVITYKVTKNGWVKAQKPQEPEEPIEIDQAYEVDFRGYMDREFAVFSHDLSEEKGRLETKAINDSIHYMFDKEYASITVQDSQGKQTFNQSYKGTDTYNAKVDTMAIKEGDYLTFKHLEPNGGDIPTRRLSIIDKQTNTAMEKAEVITYKVTKNGWVKAQKPQEPEEPIEIDQAYEVDFKGYADKEFAKFSHDLSEEKGRLETKATNDSIHYAFNEEYASVTVQDAKGKQTFNQSYKGTDTYNAKVDTMAIKEGDYLTFKHLEPNGGDIPTGRLSIIDKQTNTAMEKAETITYKVTKNGWVKAQKPQEPTENKPETPKNINASQVTTSSVKLTWDKVNNADEYVIYRDGKKVSTSKENQFNETDLQENTTYSYQIEAIGKDGTSSEKSEPLKVTTKSSDIPNDIREWTLGSFSNPIIYTEGEKVSHKGKIYVVVTTHPNYGDPSWAPDKANSLFRPI